MRRRERVVGDLRTRIGHGGQQRGLAGVGCAEQAHVGQDFELQLQDAGLAGLTERALARRAVGAGLEMQVPQPAAAAGGQDGALTVGGQVRDHGAAGFVGDDGAGRHAQLDVTAGGAEAVRAAAVHPVARMMAARVTVVEQGVDVAVGHGPHAAAPAAIAAVGPALGDEFFTSKRHAAVAAVAADRFDTHFIDEFHRILLEVAS